MFEKHKVQGWDPRKDKLLDISNADSVLNESMRNFQPPKDAVDESFMSLDSRMPSAARQVIAGVKIE